MPFEPDGTQCLCRFSNSTLDTSDPNYFNQAQVDGFERWDSSQGRWVDIMNDSQYDHDYKLFDRAGSGNGNETTVTNLDSRRVRCRRQDGSKFQATIFCDIDQPGVPGCEMCEDYPMLYTSMGYCYPQHQFDPSAWGPYPDDYFFDELGEGPLYAQNYLYGGKQDISGVQFCKGPQAGIGSNTSANGVCNVCDTANDGTHPIYSMYPEEEFGPYNLCSYDSGWPGDIVGRLDFWGPVQTNCYSTDDGNPWGDPDDDEFGGGTYTNTIDLLLGCTDPGATNYNPSANQDDGSCTDAPIINYGCKHFLANNWDGMYDWENDDFSCEFDYLINQGNGNPFRFVIGASPSLPFASSYTGGQIYLYTSNTMSPTTDYLNDEIYMSNLPSGAWNGDSIPSNYRFPGGDQTGQTRPNYPYTGTSDNWELVVTHQMNADNNDFVNILDIVSIVGNLIDNDIMMSSYFDNLSLPEEAQMGVCGSGGNPANQRVGCCVALNGPTIDGGTSVFREHRISNGDSFDAYTVICPSTGVSVCAGGSNTVNYQVNAQTMFQDCPTDEGVATAGCTSVDACNYNPDAVIDDGTCIPRSNFTCYSDVDNDLYWEEMQICENCCSCSDLGPDWYSMGDPEHPLVEQEVGGCTDENGSIGVSNNINPSGDAPCNYNPLATEDDGSCVYKELLTCFDSEAELSTTSYACPDETCEDLGFNTDQCPEGFTPYEILGDSKCYDDEHIAVLQTFILQNDYLNSQFGMGEWACLGAQTWTGPENGLELQALDLSNPQTALPCGQVGDSYQIDVIPNSIYAFASSLRYLNLANNAFFNSTIPPSFSNLPLLEKLILNNPGTTLMGGNTFQNLNTVNWDSVGAGSNKGLHVFIAPGIGIMELPVALWSKPSTANVGNDGVVYDFSNNLLGQAGGSSSVIPESFCNIFDDQDSLLYYNVSNNQICLTQEMALQTASCIQNMIGNDYQNGNPDVMYEGEFANLPITNAGLYWGGQSNLEACVSSCPGGYTSFDLNNMFNNIIQFEGNVIENAFNDYCFSQNDIQILATQMMETLGWNGDADFIMGDDANQMGIDQWWNFGTSQLWGYDDDNPQDGLRLKALHSNGDNYSPGSNPAMGLFGGPIVPEIGNLDNLKVLNISNGNYITSIPDEIGNLSKLEILDLSKNKKFVLSESKFLPEGICNLMYTGGEGGMVQLQNMHLFGNDFIPMNIETLSAPFAPFPAPAMGTNAGGNTIPHAPHYPSCLYYAVPTDGDQSHPGYNYGWYADSQDVLDWVEENLTYSNFNFDVGVDISTGNDYGNDLGSNFPQDVSVGAIPGCQNQEAANYFPLATSDPFGQCIHDGYLHFPWSEYPNGEVDSEGKSGDFGAGLSILQMIEALHSPSGCGYAETCPTEQVLNQDGTYSEVSLGYRYNRFSDLDVTGADGADPDGVVDLVDAEYFINGPVLDNQYCVPNNTSTEQLATPWCLGDARPYEFIKRVYNEIANGSPAYQFITTYFPFVGADISMFNLNFFEDYDLNGDGDLTVQDLQLWQSLGRNDIALLISQMLLGQVDLPNPTPDDGYLGEFADELMVTMSFAKEFYSENQVVGQTEDGVDIIKPVYEGFEQLTKAGLNRVPYFTGGSSGLSGSQIFTASIDSRNKPYYVPVTNGHPDSASSEVQFHVSFGHYAGSGSNTKGDTVIGSSQAVYGQYASMLLSRHEVDYGFGISSGSAGGEIRESDKGGLSGMKPILPAQKDEHIYVLNFKQSKFKDQIQNGTWTLNLSGSKNGVAKTISLTDDSREDNLPPMTTKAGRRYGIFSGSAGSIRGGLRIRERYGFFYPDVGIMIFGDKLIKEMMSGSLVGAQSTPEYHDSITRTNTNGNNQLYPTTSSLVDQNNALLFVNAMKRYNGSALNMYGEKETVDKYYACRVTPGEFNFTNNPTILSGSGRSMASGETGRMNEFSGSNGLTMAGNPNTYITEVGLFNEYGNCVATAKLNKPLQNNFEKEIVIKVKLSF